MKNDILLPVSAERRLLFISHANPEDNAAACWFATQLTLLGYEVWCDVKNSQGGESEFWLKVQKKIECDAAKFIFLLSDASRDFERKKGVYREIQSAANLGRDNFILPLRIEKLRGSVPILISPDLYISSESWANGLRALNERLIEDKVVRSQRPDYGKISSWWPALSAKDTLVREEPAELVSNVHSFEALPESVHFLRVSADGNLLAGYKRLRGVLPTHPAHAAYGDFAVSFACADDYLEIVDGLGIEDAITVPTSRLVAEGCGAANIQPQAARNAITYLVAMSLEQFLAEKGLSYKPLRYSNKKIWFPADSLVKSNNYSFLEPGGRRARVRLVGRKTYRRKEYYWHFGVQPVVDLYAHCGILLSPKLILTEPYRSDKGEKPFPIDHKKAAKTIKWWNKEWRSKILALSTWLASDEETICFQAGYQQVVLSAEPKIFSTDLSYLEMDDDALLEEIIGWDDA